MPITVQCEKCGKRLKAPDAAAGKRVKCPGCGGPVSVPAAAPAANLLDGLGEDDLLSGGAPGNLDKLSQAVGKSLPAARGSFHGADPLGPTPTRQASAKKDLRPVLIVGGSIGAAVLLVVLLVVAAIFMFGGDSSPVTAQADSEAAEKTEPAATLVSQAPAAESQAADSTEDLSALFEAPQLPGASAAPAANTASAAQAPAGSAVLPAQPGSPSQPSRPTELASASQPVPLTPAAIPAPVVNQPPPVQNIPPVPLAPLDPQQKAKNEQAAREQLKDLRQSQLALLSGDPKTLVEQMRWAPAAKRPTVGFRVGINLPVPQMAKKGRPQPPVAADSEQAIIQTLGPPGTKLLAGLDARIARGDFGGQSGSISDAGRQVTVLPGEDRGEVLAAARDRDVDLVILLKVEFQAGHHHKKKGKGSAPGGPTKMSAILSSRIVDVASGTPGWASDSLNNKNPAQAEKDATEWANDNFRQIDEFKLQPVPDLDEAQVDKRMDDLEKKKPANPLPVLLEVRYYQLKGLIPIERANAFFTQILGEQGNLLTSDDAKERKRAVEKLAKL
jgi:hypothetical protein